VPRRDRILISINYITSTHRFERSLASLEKDINRNFSININTYNYIQNIEGRKVKSNSYIILRYYLFLV
jgi:hypothetical protein